VPFKFPLAAEDSTSYGKNAVLFQYTISSFKHINMKYILYLLFLLSPFAAAAQAEVLPLEIDINSNGMMDFVNAEGDGIEVNIDNKRTAISNERLGFQYLSDLKFINKTLLITGGNEGTGGFTWTYRFRYNKTLKQVELIGFDSFSKWVSGSITKSLNLLTGKYKVTVQEYNHTAKKMEATDYQGKFTKKRIILTQLKEGWAEELDKVGSEYAPQ
jgi:hypothetical protein